MRLEIVVLVSVVLGSAALYVVYRAGFVAGSRVGFIRSALALREARERIRPKQDKLVNYTMWYEQPDAVRPKTGDSEAGA